jgi:hypothetical protein
MLIRGPIPVPIDIKEKQVAWREKQRLSDEWIKTVPKTDYAAIVEGLRALRRGKKVVG